MTNEADDIQAVEKLGQARDAIVAELRKTIVGMDEVIDEITARCTAVDSGARNVDHIMRGTLTPMMAKGLLSAMSASQQVTGVEISLSAGSFNVNVVSE